MLLVTTFHDPILDILGHGEETEGSNVVGSTTPVAGLRVGGITPEESPIIRRKGLGWRI